MKFAVLILSMVSAFAAAQVTVPVTGTVTFTPTPGPQGPAGPAGASPTAAAVAAACAASQPCVAAIAAAVKGSSGGSSSGGGSISSSSGGGSSSSSSSGGGSSSSSSGGSSSSSGGGATAGCAKTSTSYTTTGAFDSKQYGNYFANNNNWGGTKGQSFWANSQDCWGFTTTQAKDISNITSYPSATRGWSQNATAMQTASPSNPNAWTVKSGMGIQVSALTKAKLHWAFSAPLNTNTTGSGNQIRWLGLEDIYFHSTNTPDPSQFPPVVDLMINQSMADQVFSDASSTYYASEIAGGNGAKVTLGGNAYDVVIDDPDEAGYHSSGGHNIHLYMLPNAFDSKNANPNWGKQNAVTDVAAIVKYFMAANPVDDAGKPLKNYAGATVTAPLIASGLFLNAINAGIEVDDITTYTNTAFCVAMQAEPDCP